MNNYFKHQSLDFGALNVCPQYVLAIILCSCELELLPAFIHKSSFTSASVCLRKVNIRVLSNNVYSHVFIIELIITNAEIVGRYGYLPRRYSPDYRILCSYTILSICIEHGQCLLFTCLTSSYHCKIVLPHSRTLPFMRWVADRFCCGCGASDSACLLYKII